MNKIRELRKKRKLTQGELAEMLGVERSTVTKWELGINLPKSRILPALSKALKCKADVLLSP